MKKIESNTKKIKKSLLKTINDEMAFDENDIWDDDEELVRLSKKYLNKLDLPEKTLMLLYIEYGTYKSVGELLGVSAVTVGNEIKLIQQKLKEEIGTEIDNNKNKTNRL